MYEVVRCYGAQDLVRRTMGACTDPLTKKQLGYLLARQGVALDLEAGEVTLSCHAAYCCHAGPSAHSGVATAVQIGVHLSYRHPALVLGGNLLGIHTGLDEAFRRVLPDGGLSQWGSVYRVLQLNNDQQQNPNLPLA